MRVLFHYPITNVSNCPLHSNSQWHDRSSSTTAAIIYIHMQILEKKIVNVAIKKHSAMQSSTNLHRLALNKHERTNTDTTTPSKTWPRTDDSHAAL